MLVKHTLWLGNQEFQHVGCIQYLRVCTYGLVGWKCELAACWYLGNQWGLWWDCARWYIFKIGSWHHQAKCKTPHCWKAHYFLYQWCWRWGLVVPLDSWTYTMQDPITFMPEVLQTFKAAYLDPSLSNWCCEKLPLHTNCEHSDICSSIHSVPQVPELVVSCVCVCVKIVRLAYRLFFCLQ